MKSNEKRRAKRKAEFSTGRKFSTSAKPKEDTMLVIRNITDLKF